MWRQGDLFIAVISALPRRAARLGNGVLLKGEATGHSHRIDDLDTAELYQADGELYLQVVAEAARIVHQEHRPITLPHGAYRVWRQREFVPGLESRSAAWVRD